jgi:hypothetical protein
MLAGTTRRHEAVFGTATGGLSHLDSLARAQARASSAKRPIAPHSGASAEHRDVIPHDRRQPIRVLLLLLALAGGQFAVEALADHAIRDNEQLVHHVERRACTHHDC